MKTRTIATIVALAATVAFEMPFGVSAATAPQPSPLPRQASVPTPQPTAVFPAVPSVAPGYRAPDVQPSAGEVVGVTQQPFVGLSLSDAIGMALLKNPDIAVAASNVRIAAYQVREAKGAYDVRFVVQPSVKKATTPATNAFFAGGPDFQPVIQTYQNVQGGVQGQLESGGQYNIGISQSKVNDNTDINAFNPYYETSLNLTLTQPLLKNLGMNGAKRTLLLSVINGDASQSQALAGISTSISNVEDAYWDLVAAWRAVAIDEDALHQAVAQQQSNVRLAKQGQAAPIDAVESSTQVATYQQQVFVDLQQVSLVQNTLKSLVVDDPADPIWRANLVPTSSVLEIPRIPAFSDLLASAMQNRPEVRQIADLQKQADVDLKYAKNQLLPQADLQANYMSNGFAGNALPPLGGLFGTATPPPDMRGAFGQSYNSLWGGKYPNYTFGVAIAVPIGNNTARGEYSAAQEQELQARVQGNGIRERILFDVRNAMQGYQTAVASLTAARQARESAAQVYASERRRFRNGASTTFLVTQRQVELVQAEGRELQAQTSLNKAVVELQRVDGSILSANNVKLETAGSQASP